MTKKKGLHPRSIEQRIQNAEKIIQQGKSFLIGLHLRWAEISYDDPGENTFSVSHYSGRVIDVQGGFARILEDGSNHRRSVWLIDLEDSGDISMRRMIANYQSAYSRLERLRDTKPFDIYALFDPRPSEPSIFDIYYIGISRDVTMRYKQHLAKSGYNAAKNARTAEIQSSHIQPAYFILETVNGAPLALQRERYWVNTYREAGVKLTNCYDPHPDGGTRRDDPELMDYIERELMEGRRES